MLVKVLRSEGGESSQAHFEEYSLPHFGSDESTIMDVLDYISEHLDTTISYYKHSACDHGICGRCLLKANGKPSLACITRVDEMRELILEPAAGKRVVKDLVTVP